MIDRAQAAALAFEDVDGTVCPDLDGAGAEGSGSGRLPAVTAVLGGAGAGEGCDRSGRKIDHPHPVVGNIGDVEMPLRGIKREAVRLGKRGPCRRTTIAAIGRLAGAG